MYPLTDHENSGEAKGIRIEPTPALYQFLKAVQQETRQYRGRKIPLADILTSLAMMSIASIEGISEAPPAVPNSEQTEQAVGSVVPLPQYVSTITDPQNVQNIWETVEQMQASDIQPSTEAVNIAQDERKEQEQAQEQEQVNKISSANVNSHESYAREYLDNYHYCMDMLGKQQASTNTTNSEEPVNSLQEAADHKQAREPEPVNMARNIWQHIDRNSLRLDEELLPEYFPDLYEDDEQGEDDEDTEVTELEKREAVLRIVHSVIGHKQQGHTPEPRQDQEQSQPQKVLLKDNPIFKEWMKEQEASTPATHKEPSEEEKRKAAEQQAAKQVQHWYNEYTKTPMHRIYYILWKEGQAKFFERLSRYSIDREAFNKELKSGPSVGFMACVNVQFGDDYGWQWIEQGKHEAAGPKVVRAEFMKMHYELQQLRQQAQAKKTN